MLSVFLSRAYFYLPNPNFSANQIALSLPKLSKGPVFLLDIIVPFEV
jgi:hypothetical protein